VARNNKQEQTTDEQNGQASEPTDPQVDDSTEREALKTLVARLQDADLHTQRFIRLAEGRKQAYDHTKWGPGMVEGNYGVYCEDGLVGVDIDDWEAWEEAAGTEALPETFTVSTAHDGHHRYYSVPAKFQGILRAATGGSLNPSLAWGEIHASKYLVRPGSEVYACDTDKDRCCTRDSPGRYEIIGDRPIADVSVETITALLTPDAERQGSIAEFGANMSSFEDPDSVIEGTETCPDPWTFQCQVCRHSDGALSEAAVAVLDGLTDRACGQTDQGVRFDTLLDRCTANGVEYDRVAAVVRHWLDAGHLRRGKNPNWLIPRETDE
jgi:hypothetical protein